MNKLFIRLYQKILFVSGLFLKYKKSKIYSGQNKYLNLANDIKNERLLIVTGKHINGLGLLNELRNNLDEKKIFYKIFDQTSSNPDEQEVYLALNIYKENNLTAILAFGGGSCLDLAKACCCLTNKKNKSLSDLKGLFKVRGKLPLLIGIPTTAGTGSEVTIASVISNHQKKEKYAILSPKLICDKVLFDPYLLTKSPRKVIAYAGIDALTHALEAYFNKANTSFRIRKEKQAIDLIFKNLVKAYKEENNLEYLEKMLKASYLAGLSFSKAYVGYVHALGHALGAYYNLPHGFLMGVLLVEVLKSYGSCLDRKIDKLSNSLTLFNPNSSLINKRQKFFTYLEFLKDDLDLPDSLHGILKEKDIKELVNIAYKEATPLYPVPKLLSKDDLEKILYKLL